MSTAHNNTTDHSRSSGYCRAARCTGSNWSAFNIATMVVGFIIFWPIGLLALCWIISGRDVQDLPDTIRRQWSRFTEDCSRSPGSGGPGVTDNVVFSEFQQAQYERIREIKEEIKARARRFREFRANARRRADEEEFNQFMSDPPSRNDN